MLEYNKGQGDLKNWIVSETDFKINTQGKCETTFCLGNGYLGIRSATEENYLGQTRNTFVSGTFNKFSENEVTELPNVADMIAMHIIIDGEDFNLTQGTFYDYERSLNLKTAELTRTFKWKNKAGKSFLFSFKRFVSQADLHLFASKVEIKAIDSQDDIKIRSGINGQVTNSGSQHFLEGDKRIFEGQYIQMLQQTSESKINFVHNTTHNINIDGKPETLKPYFGMGRRIVDITYETTLEAEQTICIEKISNIYTDRDPDMQNMSVSEIKDLSLSNIKEEARKKYDNLHAESAKEWENIWNRIAIKIEGDDFSQLAINFALYHIITMVPKHDNRCGIGAKGLSGEGYKGHSFWDTEIFILPFFTYMMPEVARSLLEYRFKSLGGARKKAIENNYRGAMYPWEAAWIDDGEVTPVWAGADIVTGEAMKIWSGFIEQHITSDIAYAVWQYYQVTSDKDFMEKYGYEIIFDTAIFWGSRLNWNEEKKEYHINDVVGPDEYKEHVNNDAFTNYMAHWCMENAIQIYATLKSENKEVFSTLNAKLSLDQEIEILKEKVEHIYLPQINDEKVIPQDDNYLNLKEVDLSKYKKQKHNGTIFNDFNLDQINKIQVTKQASVVMMLYLLEHKFNKEVKIANFNFYEPRTLHDSSLSLSIHAILACDIDDLVLAYDLFKKTQIDLGQNMHSSNEGIHAGSLGGIFQIVVFGFGGLRNVNGNLHINPKLPKELTSLEFPFNWQGKEMRASITKDKLNVTNLGDNSVAIFVHGEKYSVKSKDKISI